MIGIGYWILDIGLVSKSFVIRVITYKVPVEIKIELSEGYRSVAACVGILSQGYYL